MKVKDPYFILEKTLKYLEEDINPSRIIKEESLTDWDCFETHFDEKIDDLHINEHKDIKWAKYELGQSWGGYDRVAWFRRKVTIPKSFKGGKVAISLLLGPRDGGQSTAEGLLYVDGAPIQGIDIWHEEAVLPKEAYADKDTIFIMIKVWSGVLEPPQYRRFTKANLQLIDEKIEQFYYTLKTLIRCIELLDADDLKRIKLTKDVNNTINLVNFLNTYDDAYYSCVYNALDYLNERLKEYSLINEIKPKVQGIGHSHIDMAWLWRLDATREKAGRTFSTVLNLMKQYPEYRFFHSSPQLYKFLQKDYPEIYQQVKEKIKSGEWEIDGGMWVESDTNIPSGESLVRQFLYGKRYIKEEFGLESEILWLPDVFGYSAALPQIMKKSGIKYFMTTKISWNQYNHFPYDTFMWSGLDRSEIFTHFITTPEDGSWFYTYNGKMDPDEVVGVWNNYKDKDKNDDLLITFGWGDGGGGPTKEMLEQSRVMENIPGIPYVKIDGAKSYFDRIYENIDKDALRKWQGELYFEYHRGTYTTQGHSKRFNRKIENNLHNLEFLLAYEMLMHGTADFDKLEIDRIWEEVLLLQFHDILPGTSIRAVYEESEAVYQQLMDKTQELILKSLDKIESGLSLDDNTLTIANTLGFLRDDYFTVSYSDKIDTDTKLFYGGERLQTQSTQDGLLCYVSNLPAYGISAVTYEKQRTPKVSDMNQSLDKISTNRFENDYFVLELNENGEIAYLYDKKNERMVSSTQPMNQFIAFEDKPQRFDAWDIDIYYKEKPYEAFKLVERYIKENGKLKTILRQKWEFNKSAIVQDMIICHKTGRIDFETVADWKEEQVLLKVYFPFGFHSDEVTYEIQYGNIKRPTHTNTEYDFAKFEVCGHRYADLSDTGYGVALLNDCKYGYDATSDRIGLTLIKSPVRPDAGADRTQHKFTYSLYPHKQDFSYSDVQSEAMKLNYPLIVKETLPAASKACVKKDLGGLITCSSEDVAVDTIKISESGDAIVVRLYEYKNRRSKNVKLKMNSSDILKVYETNLMEEHEKEIYIKDGEIVFSIMPYEIKTYKFIHK